MALTEISGEAAPEYAALKDAFAQTFEEREVGASVALFVDGELAVNLWGGHTDRARTKPWCKDTLACTFSVTKGVAAIALLQLADAGQLDLDVPVERYWPEFVSSDTSSERLSVTPRQLLSHRAGLPGFRAEMPAGIYYDWEQTTRALIAEELWWPPGTRHGYHARTYGFLIGELFRQITGLPLGEWLRRNRPDLDFYIGLKDHELDRCAQMLPARMRVGEPSSGQSELMAAMRDAKTATWAAFSNPTLGAGYMNKPEFRKSHMPAVSGHGTAAALAGLYGTIDDYLSPELQAEATTTHSIGFDEVLRTNTHFGLGFMLPSVHAPIGVSAASFGHAGAGGSIAFGDTERRLGFAFVMNQMESGVISGGRSVKETLKILY